MANPAIIQCSCLYIFTTPLPAGSIKDLLPTAFVPDADVIAGYVDDKPSYFILVLSCYDEVEVKECRVEEALQYVWGELVNRGVAVGDMPTPLEGNPHAMLGS